VFSSAFDINSYGPGEVDGMAVDPDGNTYLTGWTKFATLQTTPGVVQPQYPGCTTAIFVVKLDATGKMVFATYWGGGGSNCEQDGHSIAVDSDRNVYVAGSSILTSTFPTTPGAAFRVGSPSGADGFVLKLNSTGTAVIYSTLVPGTGGVDIAVDNLGNAYFVGTIKGSDNSLSATAGAFQSSHGGVTDAVVGKFSPTGSLLYATFIGGSATNNGGEIAVDSSGNAYIAGDSDSMDFPVTAGAYQSSPANGLSAFVAKLNAQGSALVYSTFLGPVEWVGNIRLDSQSNTYVFGVASTGFSATPGAFQSSLASPWNTDTTGGALSFVAKLNSTGTGLIYSSLFAGASRFDVDSAGNSYVAGFAGPHLPVTQGALQRCVAGAGTNMFLAQLNPTGQLVAASYFGGTGFDSVEGIGAGPRGSVYLAENVGSTDFPGLEGVVVVVQGTLAVSKLYISDPGKTDLPCLTKAVQNGASFENTPLAPGELVTLRGLGLGPDIGASMEIDPAGHASDGLDGTQVRFDGKPAPLLYAQSEQINVQVPWELAGASSVQIQVAYQGALSNTATVPMQGAAPALFYVPPVSPPLAGTPPPGAILNQDGTPNSPSNPAARGSIVSLFGTGGGITAPSGVTGGFAPLSPPTFLTLPVTVQFNSSQAEVVYAGAAPTLISGVFQVNVRVPDAVAPGIVGVYVQIGGVGSKFFPPLPYTYARWVTMAVK